MEDITQQQQSLDKFEQLGKIHEKSLKGKALSCSTGYVQAPVHSKMLIWIDLVRRHQ